MQQDRLSQVLLHKLLPVSYTKKRKIAAALALSVLFVTRHSFVRPTTTVRLVPPRDDDADNNNNNHSGISVRPWTTTHELCTRRQRRRYNFSSPSRFQSCRTNRGETCVAVVVTVNLGFYDFFVNWYRHYQTNRRRNDNNEDDGRRWLVIVAEDSQIYQSLTSDDAPFVRDGNVEIVLGDGSEAQSVVAEEFGTEGYRSLVSGRATHLLNVVCGLEWAVSSSPSSSLSSMLRHFFWGLPHATTKAAAHWIVIYTDIDAVWLQDPIPMVRTALYNHDADANDINVPSSTIRRTPRYDLVAAVDERHNSMGFETYYCTGFVAFVDTPATVEFLSRWEEELMVKPTFNQPIFNTLLLRQEQEQQQQQSLSLPTSPLTYAGLSETQFVSGKFWDSANPNDKDIVVLHNNFVEGAEEKRRRFREKGLWMESLSDVSTSSNGVNGVRDEQHPWTQEHYRRPVRVSYVTSFWAEGGGGGDGGGDEQKPSNPHRREMEAALLVNIHNPHFDQIVVFLDGVYKAGTTCEDFLRHMRELDGKVGLTVLERTDPFSKVSCVNILGDQPNYFQMFNNTLQEDVVLGDVVVLSNADQAFDDSVSIAHNLNPNVLVVLGTRGFPMGEIPPIIQHFYVTVVGEGYLPKQEGAQKSNDVDNMCATNPYSWDTWIFDKSVLRGHLKEEHFQRPLANKKMITFSMNEMGAENAALWALQQAFPFSSLYNACDKIRSWSFHLTPKTHKVHETSWLCERRAKYPCGSVPYPWGGIQLKGRLRRSHPGVPKDPECAFANNCFLQEAIPLSVVEDVAT